MTPTARSTKWLRDRGWIVAKVEQRIHMPKAPYPVTRDAFGFGDILAAHPIGTIALIQSTGGQGGNLAKRARKICTGDDGDGHVDERIPLQAIDWIRAGGLISCHGWAKRKPRGQKRSSWTLKMKSIMLIHDRIKSEFRLEAQDVEYHDA